jgi:hypothetical protein
VVTLSLTNPSGSEITIGLAESGYRAFVVQIGRASALTPLNRGSSPGYVWSGTADPEVPVPARASIVEAIGALHIGAVLPAGELRPDVRARPGRLRRARLRCATRADRVVRSRSAAHDRALKIVR